MDDRHAQSRDRKRDKRKRARAMRGNRSVFLLAGQDGVRRSVMDRLTGNTDKRRKKRRKGRD